jgi:ATP-dependent protease ClpP protease subunit|tara:strand:- start:758 stop:1402 length:645 start_codon:yes stop_codon:yes gene_type:complete
MNNADKDLLYDLHNYGANIDTREIFLHNYYASDDDNPGVEYKMSNNFLKNIRALEIKSASPIVIHMQSVGGEWSDGMAIYDAISMSRCHVTMIAYGQAESMSSIIFQAADKRFITPNTYFMSHYGSTAAGGGYLDVQNWVKYEKYICDIMIDIYAGSCVGGKFFKEKYGSSPDLDKVKTYLTRKLKSGDWYINADDAVYYGFADGVIDSWQNIK